MRGRRPVPPAAGCWALALLMTALLQVGRADAQPGGFLHVNGTVQAGDRTVTHGLRSGLYGELATYEATLTSSGSGLLDASAGVTWGGLGAALGVTARNASGAIGVGGSVPSPLFTNRHRAASLERPGLRRQEVGVHLQAVYVLPLADMAPALERLQVMVTAGPSWFRLQHEAVTAVGIGREVAPYTAAPLVNLTTAMRNGEGYGYNAGVDVAYLMTRWLGVGILLRYTGGSVELELPGGTQPVDVGGLQAGAGLRFQF